MLVSRISQNFRVVFLHMSFCLSKLKLSPTERDGTGSGEGSDGGRMEKYLKPLSRKR